MLRFLHLFDAFRELLQEKQQLEDEIRHVRSRMEQAEARERDAREESLRCREKVADFLGKRSGLGTIFGSLDSIPDVPMKEPQVVETIRPLASDYVADMERQFSEQIEATLARIAKETGGQS